MESFENRLNIRGSKPNHYELKFQPAGSLRLAFIHLVAQSFMSEEAIVI